MPPYDKMPDPEEWNTRVGKSSVAALQRIAELITEYHTLLRNEAGERTADTTDDEGARIRGRRGGAIAAPSDSAALKLTLEFQIERASRFLLKLHRKYRKAPLLGDDLVVKKIGGRLAKGQLEALEELHEFIFDSVKGSIPATDADYVTKIIDRFGRNVSAKEAAADQRLLDQDRLIYYTDLFSQKQLKLSFRKGLAYRWSFNKKERKLKESLYDTDAFGDANMSEDDASLYVMDGNGAIYVLGQEEEVRKLKHSSLLGGTGILCAGTIRIEQGQVQWLTGKSGHYLPTVEQVVNVLERLRQYQVDLTNVLVFREDFTTGFTKPVNSVGKNLDACDALTLLRDRLWPVSGQKDRKAMRVDDKTLQQKQ